MLEDGNGLLLTVDLGKPIILHYWYEEKNLIYYKRFFK